MPGIADVDVQYDTSFDGGAHFYLTATLTGAAAPDEGADVARTFIDEMVRADFRHFDVWLDLNYQRTGAGAAMSGLSVRYYFDE